MRLKCKVRHLKEESFFLNRIQQGWNSLQVTEKQQLLFNFNNNHRVSYSSNLASPSEDESDRDMSLSSPEIMCRNGSVEYDVLSASDLDSNCTSPLLNTSTLKEHTNGGNRELGVRDDCNNNGNSASSSCFSPREDLESGDSIFSDISEDSSQDYSLDNSEGSHYNYDVSETEINSREELIRLNELSFRDQIQSNLPDCVAQEWQVYSTLFKKQKFGKTLIKQHASKDQHMYCSVVPESGSSEFMDFTPISETSTSSDFDINMATETLNNFSMATSKHCDIQCLVNKEEKNANINIQQNESTTTFLEEPKILNTASAIPKNITDKFQNEQAFEFITSKVKCEFDSGEKENRKKENINDSPPLKKSSTWINTKYGGPIASAVKPVIETLFMEHLFSTNDDKKDKTTYFSSCKKNSGEMPEPLDIDSDNLTPEIKKTNERSENPYEHVELPMPNTDTGLRSRDDTSMISLQKQHPGDLAVISPCHHVTKQKKVYSVRNSDVETFLLSNTLNNNSIMDSAVYKNMAENVKLPIACLSTQTTQPNSLTKRDESKHIYLQKDKYKSSSEVLGNFDVCNIEITMPKIDWTAMETHLTQAAKEPDWYLRHQHDREEIRKKLAMDSDSEDYYCGEKVTKKPSLSTRLQSGMNLQICFMNETASDQESQGSDQDAENYCQNDNFSEELSNEKIIGGSTDVSYYDKTKSSKSLTESTNSSQVSGTKRQRPSFFFNRPRRWSLQLSQKNRETKEKVEEDFITRQARLQTEARLALAQAKVMARMQMEVEKQRKKKSPIADIVGIPFPDGHCHLSRQFLTDMNIAQLQVILNDLHTQIENFNEELVQLLLERDDLHMQQDSMLVDIEDLTRYLGAKNEALCNQ